MHALVIDDSKPVRSILTKVLNGLQFQCIEAQNGVEALDRLSHMPRPTLITLNRHMPEMDGFETTRRIRAGDAGEKYLNVPVIALTANAMKGDRERCEAAGMDDYISKPFSAEDLLSAVARMC